MGTRRYKPEEIINKLREAEILLIELAEQYGRYGYRMITDLLRNKGYRINHKRVERIWRAEGLKVPSKQPKRRRLWLNDGSCVRLRPEHPNHVWSYDFVMNKTSDGRKMRMLNVIDEYTFDNGPHPTYTPQLLAILKKYNIKSTFFVIGKMVEQYPELVRAEDAAGNLVANHTYHHVNLNHVPLDEIALEWEACNAAVKSVIKKDMGYCRPPGGDYDVDVITAAMDSGLTTVLWTDDPGDYASPGDKVIKTRVLDRIGNGGIILLHDGVQQTVDVLPQIIESLQKRGFKFQTAEEMDASLHSAHK